MMDAPLYITHEQHNNACGPLAYTPICPQVMTSFWVVRERSTKNPVFVHADEAAARTWMDKALASVMPAQDPDPTPVDMPFPGQDIDPGVTGASKSNLPSMLLLGGLAAAIAFLLTRK